MIFSNYFIQIILHFGILLIYKIPIFFKIQPKIPNTIAHITKKPPQKDSLDPIELAYTTL